MIDECSVYSKQEIKKSKKSSAPISIFLIHFLIPLTTTPITDPIIGFPFDTIRLRKISIKFIFYISNFLHIDTVIHTIIVIVVVVGILTRMLMIMMLVFVYEWTVIDDVLVLLFEFGH